MKTLPTREELIAEIIKPGMVGAEIGVYRGAFSKQILALPVQKLFCIDAWTRYKAYELDSLCHTNQDDNHEATKNELADDIQKGRCGVIRGFSSIVVKSWETPLDFLFLDSIHNYEFVIEDLRNWEKHIKPGGVIMCHDFTETSAGAIAMKFGVVRAVKQFCEENGWHITHVTQEPDWPSCAISRNEPT